MPAVEPTRTLCLEPTHTAAWLLLVRDPEQLADPGPLPLRQRSLRGRGP